MIFRLLSVWICVAVTAWVDFCLWGAATALRTRLDMELNGKPLPGLTQLFMPANLNRLTPSEDPAFPWPYYFPLLVIGAAVWVTWKHRRDVEKTTLFCVASLALTIGFGAFFLTVMTLPFVSIISSLGH